MKSKSIYVYFLCRNFNVHVWSDLRQTCWLPGRHKISRSLEFRSDRTSPFGGTCPWASKKILIYTYTFKHEYLLDQLASFGTGKIYHITTGSDIFSLVEVKRWRHKTWDESDVIKLARDVNWISAHWLNSFKASPEEFNGVFHFLHLHSFRFFHI